MLCDVVNKVKEELIWTNETRTNCPSIPTFRIDTVLPAGKVIVVVEEVNMDWTTLVTIPTPLLGARTARKDPGVTEKSVLLVDPSSIKVTIPWPP